LLLDRLGAVGVIVLVALTAFGLLGFLVASDCGWVVRIGVGGERYVVSERAIRTTTGTTHRECVREKWNVEGRVGGGKERGRAPRLSTHHHLLSRLGE
jgi:hypothetical protein